MTLHLEVLRRTLRKGCEDACNSRTIAFDGSLVGGAKRTQRCDENSITVVLSKIKDLKVFDAFGQLRMYVAVNMHFKYYKRNV
jgi:hypothetical protein